MFKTICKKIIATLLLWEARIVLWRHRPRIIGITGSVGKTTAKEATVALFASRVSVWASPKSYNSELGVPLSILGSQTAWFKVWQWFAILFGDFLGALLTTKYPRWLVLELGVDRPGDIRRFLRWLRLDKVVLTRLPAVPPHVEFFESPAQLVSEKLLLVDAVKSGGVLVVNHDDLEMAPAAATSSARLLTYGFSEKALVRGSNVEVIYRGRGEKKLPVGLLFKIDHVGNSVPIKVLGLLGQHQLYGILAAVACALSEEINLVEIGAVLANWTPPVGRMRLLPGVKGSVIIDDTYNSSPAALEEALKTLGELDVAGRKIAVLGDMLELGAFTIEAHREAGEQAAAACDLLVGVGIRAKFILESAAEAGLAREKIFHYDEARDAGKALENLLGAGDAVLVKGSQAVRLERVVEEVMAEPARKQELLVRQEKEWQNRL